MYRHTYIYIYTHEKMPYIKIHIQIQIPKIYIYKKHMYVHIYIYGHRTLRTAPPLSVSVGIWSGAQLKMEGFRWKVWAQSRIWVKILEGGGSYDRYPNVWEHLKGDSFCFIFQGVGDGTAIQMCGTVFFTSLALHKSWKIYSLFPNSALSLPNTLKTAPHLKTHRNG